MGDMIWEMKCDPEMKKLRWYVAPIWRFDFGKGITKVICPDCDDMWLLSEKPILWLVLASQMDPRAAQCPKVEKPFNWKSHLQVFSQLDIKVDVIWMSLVVQTTSRLLERKTGTHRMYFRSDGFCQVMTEISLNPGACSATLMSATS